MTRATPEQLQPLVAGWLPNQRWFAGKGREASVDVAPLAVLSATSPQVTIWTARVVYEDAAVELYQLPLVEREAAEEGLEHVLLGSYADGASAYGVRQLLGDVWEWTSTFFAGYPGFRAFPYKEYSEVFFGQGYKVLKGGSWATHPLASRPTFRNWDFPIRRQIFAGFRCARDA